MNWLASDWGELKKKWWSWKLSVWEQKEPVDGIKILRSWHYFWYIDLNAFYLRHNFRRRFFWEIETLWTASPWRREQKQMDGVFEASGLCLFFWEGGIWLEKETWGDLFQLKIVASSRYGIYSINYPIMPWAAFPHRPFIQMAIWSFHFLPVRMRHETMIKLTRSPVTNKSFKN